MFDEFEQENVEFVTQEGETTDLVAPHNAMTNLAFVNPADLPDLDKAEIGMSIEPKYFEFKNAGDSLRGVYIGNTTITSKTNKNIIPTVVLQNKDGFFLNSGASLVDQLGKLPTGTAVQVTFTGTEKTSNGYNVKKFDVRILNTGKNVPVHAPATTQAPAPVKKEITRQDLISHYSALWERGKRAKVEGIENYAINPKMTDNEILDLGKELKVKVEAAEKF
jgi:hypothetical protein